MSSYGLVIKDIEIDIHILEDLQRDVGYYREIFETDVEDPHTNAIHKENYIFSIEQFQQHGLYLLGRMEDWLKLTLEDENIPVSLRLYRVLHQLREQK